MKKFIVSISAVICLVISNLMILPVTAAEAPTVSDKFPSIELIQEHYGLSGDYFSYSYTTVNDYGDWYVEYSVVYYFDVSALDFITKEEQNGIYTFDTTLSAKRYRVSTTYRSNDPDNLQINYAGSSDNYGSKFVYDSNLDTVYINDTQVCTAANETYKGCQFDIEGINNDPNNLDVRVTFSPRLEGDVDRSFIMPDGNKGYASSLTMFVENHSSFAVQFIFDIYKANQVNLRPGGLSGGSLDTIHSTVYDDDPVFSYYSNEWVYNHKTDSHEDFWNTTPFKMNKATRYHYLSAGSSVTLTFDYDMINLVEGEEYKVIVTANRNDYDITSEMWVHQPSEGDPYPELKQISVDTVQTVYSSTFKMLQYSDVKYNSNKSNYGVLPYNGANGITDAQRYEFSRNALENEDGSVDYDSKNFYDGENSWVKDMYNPTSFDSISGSSRYNSVVSQSSSIFGFFNSALSLFPSDFRTVFNIGFWSIIIIAIVKKVF